MTLNDWNRRNDFKHAWKAFRKSEAGEALIRVLMNLGLPSATLPPPNVDFIDWNATLNARREGYFEVVRILSTLSEEPGEPSNLPEPWETRTNETNQE
jgi:hypothetical protein